MSLKGRVIAGKYRHRPLEVLANQQTRTTKDRVKEGMFSALQNDLEAAVVLDLFAGSGSLGIEAVSRGAIRAIFVEKDFNSVKVLKKNVSFISEEVEILVGDYKIMLSQIAPKSIDILFLDPPYDDKINLIIANVIKAEILKDNYIIVVESDSPFTDILNNVTIKTYKYGITFVTIIKGRKL